MNLNLITDRVNQLLAGENLSYSELTIHLDTVIDDINHELNSTFPAFSEFTALTHAGQYPDYNFFPNNYLRSVVCLGAAYYFYLTDEEGSQVAIQYSYKYKDALFLMQRDYSNKVPLAYQATEQGYLETPENFVSEDDVDAGSLHPAYYLNGDIF
jgi:hypothetical protein